jgi:hypothetical protein
MAESLQIAGVCERDLDLLLVEELIATSAFRAWLAAAAGLPPIAAHLAPVVKRSVTHSSGESDVEMHVQLADGLSAAVLIENKVDAALQPAQPERYTQRGASYVTDGKCSLVRTLIIAPERYFGSDGSRKGFDAALTYEEVDRWFADRSELGDRAIYKRALISAAIEKATLGYQPIADRQMTAFWRSYHAWVQRDAPALNMPDPKGRPPGSTFIFFKPDRLPRSLLLVHKFAHGYVDLELAGWGERLSDLRQHVQPIAPVGWTLVRIGKSAALRTVVPALDATSPDSQEAEAVEGVRAAVQILSWLREHQETLSSIGASTA